MSVIRVEKTKYFTVMSNYHFRDKRLSLKAKGLLSEMLSLPDDWDYTVAGLIAINKDGKAAIQGMLKELEQFGYLTRTRIQDEKGQFDYLYCIYESPQTEKPQTENPFTEKPCTENPPQYNTKTSNTDLLNTKNKRFIPPSEDEVRAYCEERKNGIDAARFVNFYTAKDWMIGKNKMKDWRAAVRTWEQKSKPVHYEDDELDGIL